MIRACQGVESKRLTLFICIVDTSFDATFSFLGVPFATPAVSRVRISSGNQILASGTSGDLVLMNDFIFAEPNAVPEPATLALVKWGLIAFGIARRRTSHKSKTSRES